MKCVVGLLLFLQISSFAQKLNLVLPVGHTSSVSSAVYSPDGKYIVTASWDNTAKIWQAADGRLLHELKGHTASLTSACFSKNGKFIITTSKDNSARVWETASGNFLYELKGHKEWVISACFSPDGKYIVTASSDSTAKIWQTSTRQLRFTLLHNGPINNVVFSPDGKYIATASKDSSAAVWQVSNGQLLYKLKHKDWVNTVSFRKDGKYILTASNDGTAKLWVTLDGHLQLTLNGHSNGVNTAVFSHDNKYILTASKDSTARLWLALNGQLIHTLKIHNDVVNTARFSPDGKYIVTASDDNFSNLWQTTTGQLITQLSGHTGSINTAYFSPDNKYILTASTDNTSKIWTTEGKIAADLRGHTSVVTSATFSSNGKYMVTASWDNTAKIWDALNGKLLSELHGHAGWINSAVFNPDGDYVVTASSDNTARIWSVPDGKLIHELQGHSDWVSSAIFSPDGKYIATTSWDNTAKIWQVKNGQLISEMKGHTAMIKSATFSPDNKNLVTASWDNTAKVWEVLSGNQLIELKGHKDIVRTAVYSSDGNYILTSSWDSTAIIWNARSGEIIRRLKGHNGSLNTAIFSSNGKYVVTASLDNTAKTWTTDGKLLFELKGHTNSVASALFSPDEKYLVTASWDNTAKIWSMNDGKLLSELKGHTGSVKSANWSPDGKYIVTTSEDNTIKKWDVASGKFLYTFFAVDSTDYLAIDAEGRYDGSETARKMLYYVCENEITDLEQFKDLSWEPGLVSKLTGSNSEPITAKKISEINICNFTPQVEEKGLYNGYYRYQVKPRQGGIGEIQVYVNNKLVETYKPASFPVKSNIYQVAISQKKMAEFFVSDAVNKILVKATTSGGTVSSRGAYTTTIGGKKNPPNPNIYLLSIGISQYKEAKLNLNYASKDAADFASAITSSAQKLVNTDGKQHVFTYKINTEAGNLRWPAKLLIEKLVDSVAAKAKPDDILIIFFAGHGILQDGQKSFFLLTADASTFELEGIEKQVAISTEELKEWLRKIKANKQVLILDACNSGQVVQNLQQVINKRDVPADQQRALESLKDKTGTFILSASASGQSAYETSLYGQGLLTYSLLSGIKLGGGLRDNKFIDVTRWFNYASDYVKVLAKEIGGRQDPQLIGNASFEIGIVDKEVLDQIQLSIKKKIFRRSKFIQDEELLNDDLDLSSLIDKELKNLSEKGKASPLLFVPDNILLDDYAVRGKYSITGNKILLKVSLFKGQKERIHQFDVIGTSDQKEDLAWKVVDTIAAFLK
jgi:WD40 repeat protein